MDALVSLISAIEPYHWLALGLVLLIAEMMSGTTYLLWPAVAAGATGLIGYLAPTHWALEISLFAALVIGLTAFGRPLVRNRLLASDAPALNERGAQMIGARGLAAQDFAGGVGSVKINDSVWRAVSDEAISAGARVVVISVEGVTLSVKNVA